MRTWKAAAALAVVAVIIAAAAPALAVPPGDGVQALPRITVTGPAGGEYWYTGNWQDITWTAFGGAEPVDVYVQKGDGTPVKIGTNRSGGKANLWLPASLAQGYEYRVIVASVSKPAVKGISKYIHLSPLPTFRITDPNGGETWSRGATHNITWTYTGYPYKVSLLLFHYGDAFNYKTIAEEVPAGSNGSGSYTWKIPDDIEPGTDYRVWIIIPHTAANDVSDQNFTVRQRLDVQSMHTEALHQ